MRHRLFIAVNLPEKIKKNLSQYGRKWPELPVRWTKPDNLHVTLEFLGYVISENIMEIHKIIEDAAARHSSFPLILNRICYGPPGKMPPRMIWAEGEKSKELGSLKEDIQVSLSGLPSQTDGGPEPESKNRAFSPHVTLGRIRAWDFKKIDPEERPEVDEEISFSFSVDSIEIMESRLKKGGPDYFVLESCKLKN
jgi:RNA 2',3'-cyclic 3'-phosphodiesterase